MNVTQMADSIMNEANIKAREEISKRAKERAEDNSDGMNVHGRGHLKTIVPVDKEFADKYLEQNKKEFIKWNGMSKSTTKLPDMLKKHLFTSVPPEKRISVGYTLMQMSINQSTKFVEKIKHHNPNWTFGEPFDPKILDEQSVDTYI